VFGAMDKLSLKGSSYFPSDRSPPLPRARLDGSDGKTTEWKSKTLRAYQRRTLANDALIASTYSTEGACELPGRVETCSLHTCREVGDDGD
jgi:hypothetical protein